MGSGYLTIAKIYWGRERMNFLNLDAFRILLKPNKKLRGWQ
jgi:hypothetical protein